MGVRATGLEVFLQFDLFAWSSPPLDSWHDPVGIRPKCSSMKVQTSTRSMAPTFYIGKYTGSYVSITILLDTIDDEACVELEVLLICP